MYLGKVNCIYDDGSVISLDMGPCQDVLEGGASLVDANVSATEITVTATPPTFDWGGLLLFGVALLMIGGGHVHGRRR
jgi:hypothetical protein